jgi:protein-disulfide isomerase
MSEAADANAKMDADEAMSAPLRCADDVEAYLPALTRASGTIDPKARYRVPVGRSPVDGEAGALVTWVIATDVGDPGAARLLATVTELRARYGADLRVVWKSFIASPQASQAGALGLCAAGRQGQAAGFLAEAHRRTFGASTYTTSARITLDDVDQIGAALGLDARFATDVCARACRDEVIADQRLALSLGASAAPATWINGRPVAADTTITVLRSIIDAALRDARTSVGDDPARAASYYQRLISTARTAP